MLKILQFQCYLIYFLASIKILLCFFFLFLVMLNKFFSIPVTKKNARVKLALAIPAGTPITLSKK